MTVPSGLERFDPRIASWFEERFGSPTGIQRAAWGPIAAGEHVLVTAPTGSGKTLTGFLWALQQLATGVWESGEGVRVLYVSPMKALNADIERNLVEPLAGIRGAFAAVGAELPAIRVAVRSGDTPPAERQRMLRRPPEILITTPESLNLLLLSRAAAKLFAGLRTVILDEIHAVAGSKRGVHLITAVDRLVPLAGEFQRLGISATVKPLERVAGWMGGFRVERGVGGEPRYLRRRVEIVRSADVKRYEIAVRVPESVAALEPEERSGDGLWGAVAGDLRRRIEEARSTLVFTNSRRLAEKLTRLINETGHAELAWSHHGSLSRELRSAVEERLKRGELPALVATSSLELGIDIGALDQVLLVQSPRSLASAAQRVGRAGHGVGDTSRARFYPVNVRDLLECAVSARAVVDGEIEPVQPVRSPLDLLAQWILAVTAREEWGLDELFDLARASDPFHELSRRQFDLVVEMLAGRYAEARIAELRPRLAVDRLAGRVSARPGTARLLAQSGGTIPDRGYFQLRIEESNARLGELDEEFVWERALGDSFLLGTQSWRIRRITANEVFVSPSRGAGALAPFWRADARDRGIVFSERIGTLLERLEAELERSDPGIERRLVEEELLEEVAARALLRDLRETRAALGGELPHRRRIVFEETREKTPRDPLTGGAGRRQVLLYTFWGGTVNRPLALALAAAWEEVDGTALETFADDDAILMLLPPEADPRELLAKVRPERLELLLRGRLEGSGLFGAQFRQNAQRALLLPRAGAGRRTPLWLSRESAKRLLEAVARFDDFPITLETWRSTLLDELDLPSLKRKLEEVESGAIRVASVRSDRASPLAAGLLWRRTNDLMYEDDVPVARRPASLRGDLLREVALGERPRFERELVERYRRKAQRLLPGYAPQSASELLEWVKERLWIPEPEWTELLAAVDRETGGGARAMVDELLAAGRLTLEREDGQKGALAVESAARLDLASPDRFEEWLRFQPPLPLSEAAAKWGVGEEALARLIAPLVAAETLVEGALVEAGTGERRREIATLRAVETLLRWRRSAQRPELAVQPLARLPLFLAQWQGLTDRGNGPEALQAAMERLFGFPAPAGLWESDLLPSRLEPYLPSALDTLFEESPLRWVGTGRERVAFAFAADLDLLSRRSNAEAMAEDASDDATERVRTALAGAPRGLDLEELLERTQLPSRGAIPALWRLAWGGEIAGDSMRSLRQGIAGGFAAPDLPELPRGGERAGGGGRRALLRRWQTGRPSLGRWYLTPSAVEADPIAEAEAARELARLLLDRYGVLFRELLAGELPGTWARISRALRTLELSGEIVAGRFFDGVPGLQFATSRAIERLREGVSSSATWWCSALDPASLCGVDLDLVRGSLPRRVASTRLVYRGAELVGIFRRGGQEVELHAAPDDPELAALTEPIRVALTRFVDPEGVIDIATINGEPAARSHWAHAFDEFERVREGDLLRVRRRYRPPAAESAPFESRFSHPQRRRIGSLDDERNEIP